MSQEQQPQPQPQPQEKKTKPAAERLTESVTILKKLRDLGIPASDASQRELSHRFNEWVKGGEAWVGNVDFHQWNRRAKVLLPTKPGAIARCDFLVQNFGIQTD